MHKGKFSGVCLLNQSQADNIKTKLPAAIDYCMCLWSHSYDTSLEVQPTNCLLLRSWISMSFLMLSLRWPAERLCLPPAAKHCHGNSFPAGHNSKHERNHVIPCVSEWFSFLLLIQDILCDPENVIYILSRVGSESQCVGGWNWTGQRVNSKEKKNAK